MPCRPIKPISHRLLSLGVASAREARRRMDEGDWDQAHSHALLAVAQLRSAIDDPDRKPLGPLALAARSAEMAEGKDRERALCDVVRLANAELDATGSPFRGAILRARNRAEAAIAAQEARHAEAGRHLRREAEEAALWDDPTATLDDESPCGHTIGPATGVQLGDEDFGRVDPEGMPWASAEPPSAETREAWFRDQHIAGEPSAEEAAWLQRATDDQRLAKGLPRWGLGPADPRKAARALAGTLQRAKRRSAELERAMEQWQRAFAEEMARIQKADETAPQSAPAPSADADVAPHPEDAGEAIGAPLPANPAGPSEAAETGPEGIVRKREQSALCGSDCARNAEQSGTNAARAADLGDLSWAELVGLVVERDPAESGCGWGLAAALAREGEALIRQRVESDRVRFRERNDLLDERDALRRSLTRAEEERARLADYAAEQERRVDELTRRLAQRSGLQRVLEESADAYIAQTRRLDEVTAERDSLADSNARLVSGVQNLTAENQALRDKLRELGVVVTATGYQAEVTAAVKVGPSAPQSETRDCPNCLGEGGAFHRTKAASRWVSCRECGGAGKVPVQPPPCTACQGAKIAPDLGKCQACDGTGEEGS